MSKADRRATKVVLFIVLVGLSFIFVRPYDDGWTASEASAWWRASDWLGVRDPEDLYISVWMSIELIVAVLAYVVIMKLWRCYRRKCPDNT